MVNKDIQKRTGGQNCLESTHKYRTERITSGKTEIN